LKILLARMTHLGWERAELGSTAALWAAKATGWPHVEEMLHVAIDACPTPVARNRVVELARANHCDVIVCVDADTRPHPDFLEAALEELRAGGPKVVVSPYVCAGDLNRVQVFRWSTNEDATGNERLGRFAHVSRDEAARLSGREEVACAGTGAFACHTAAFDKIKAPYFDYEYGEENRTTVVSTEDVRCFRDLSLAGVPIVCLWSHWADHFKTMALSRPAVLTAGDVAERTRRLLLDEATLPKIKVPQPVVDFPAGGRHGGNGKAPPRARGTRK